MESDGRAFLTRQLHDAPTPGVAGLADEHLAHLAGALCAARQRQAEELTAASEQALAHIPRLLRGPVKKIVG
ncbi:MAG TPA: hypothetical protein VFN48_05630 [Solirubrobacteraceae bacterium]|nr:hypothetical protein [Solirubrobacteraceae bacterium]